MMEQLATTDKPRRTRAQVLKDKVVIRLALDSAGPDIAAVLKANGIEFPGCDWSKVFPHWLIACVDDEVIGCIQVMPARPVGWLEFLFTKPTAPFKLRVIATKKLAFQGAATLKMGGAYWLCCTVEHTNKKFYDVLKKYDVIEAGNAALMVKRLK